MPEKAGVIKSSEQARSNTLDLSSDRGESTDESEAQSVGALQNGQNAPDLHVAALTRADNASRARLISRFQSQYGNAYVQRLVQRTHSTSGELMQLSQASRDNGYVQRQRHGQMPLAAVANEPETGGQTMAFLRGTTIRGRRPGGREPRQDAEVEREQQISRGATAALNQGTSTLNIYRINITDAVNDFRTSGQRQIDGMEGDPSDLWGLAPTFVGGVAGVLAVLFPELSIPLAIATAVQGLAQTAATTAVKEARGDAKQQAKDELDRLANLIGNAARSGVNDAQRRLQQSLLRLSLENDEVRALLQDGTPEGLAEVLVQGLGVLNPDQVPLYTRIRQELEVRFAEWMARQHVRSEMTNFQWMLTTVPGRPEQRRLEAEVGQARAAATERVATAARERHEPEAE